MSGALLAQASLWLLVLLPAVVGAGLALSRTERVAPVVSVTTAVAALALSLVVAVARPQVSVPFMAGTDFSLHVDGLAAVILPTVAVVSLLVLVFSVAEIRSARGRFHGLMLLFAGSVSLVATSATLPTLLLGWEVMGAMSYALIGFWWREEHRVASGLVAFLTTRSADLGLYVASGAALAGGAGLGLEALADAGPGWRDVVAAGVLVAAIGKAAQLPLSFWLSRAMEGPSPVSALLHSAAMVAMGGYLLLRLEPLLAATSWAPLVTAWVGVGTAVLMGVVAVMQTDLKQLLAASTSAQLGFVVLAAGVGTTTGGVAQLVAHAATKALLFLAAGAWLTALGTKRLEALVGVARRWPVVGWTAAVGALSLAGIPPFALWAAKDAVLSRAVETSVWLYAAGLLGAALSAAYAGKALVVLWRHPSRADERVASQRYDEEEDGTRRVSPLQQPPLVVLAVGAVGLGVLALPAVHERLATTVGEEPGGAVPAWELAVSALVALLVVWAVSRRSVPEVRLARDWWRLEQATQVVVVGPVLALAHRLARFDDEVLDRAVLRTAAAVAGAAPVLGRFDDDAVDGAVTGLARSSASVAGRLARADDDGVDGAVRWSTRAFRRLGALARRPQTGQLHQYYLQAVVVLAAGVLLLVTVR